MFRFRQKIEVKEIDDIMNVYLSMLRDGYCFVLDREVLMACLVDITYVLNPSNDNMEIVKLNMMGEDDDEDEDEDEN